MRYSNIDNFVLTRHAIERYAQRYNWGTYNFFGLKRKIIQGINQEIKKCCCKSRHGQEYWHVPNMNLRIVTKKDYKIHKDVIVTIVQDYDKCLCMCEYDYE